MLLLERPWATTLTLTVLLALASCQEKKAGPAAKAEPRAAASVAAKGAPLPELPRKIFLILEYRNEAPEYVHSAWFMDTAGNEFRFASKQMADDLLRKITDDSLLDAREIEQLVAASKPLPHRVSEAALSQALSALKGVVQDPVEPVAQSPCNELGQTYLFAYVLEPRLGLLSARFLRGEQCAAVTSRNPSPGATDLADWLEKLGKPKLLPI